MTDHYDVIIIGTGAGGGTLAYKLAGSGKRILNLSAGIGHFRSAMPEFVPNTARWVEVDACCQYAGYFFPSK